MNGTTKRFDIRCPLCFKWLGPKDKLLRHCFVHGRLRAVRPYKVQKNGRQTLYHLACDAEPECLMPPPQGLFLLHDGCECHSPFFDSASGQVVFTPPTIEITPGKQVPFSHHLIDRLKMIVENDAKDPKVDASKKLKLRPEMWFPYELYVATNARVNDNDRFGPLVLLSGAAAVGKSTASTAALAPQTYEHATARFQSIEDYAYVRPQEGIALPAFFNYLYADAQIWNREENAVWVISTPPGSRSVRVAMFQNTTAGGHSGSVGDGMELAVKTAGEAAAARRLGPARLRVGRTRACVAFWDTPGEDNHLAIPADIAYLAGHVDSVAIFIDATHLTRFGAPGFPGGAAVINGVKVQDSIAVAVNRHRTLGNGPARPSVCVIVTKLDLVLAGLEQQAAKEPVPDPTAKKPRGTPPRASAREELEIVKRLLDTRLRWNDWDAARKLLMNWLSAARPRAAELDLHKLLKTDDEFAVFVVSIEGLNNPTPPIVPYGRGMLQFVNWCFRRDEL